MTSPKALFDYIRARSLLLLEILACGCGGIRRLIATIEEGRTATKILQRPAG